MWAICKKEWTHYFSGLTGYLIIGFYLVVNGLFLFVLPNYNILDFGYASLQVYFDFAPWFLLVLIPAITMRSFSDEYKQGTYEILKSLPVSPLSLVTAKFLGAIFIVLTALLPTIFYAVAIDALSSVGGLDWGATLGAYLGLVLLAATYTAIGIFSSALTKNSLIALLVSIVLSLVIYKGFDLLSTIAIFKNGMDYYVSQLGLSAHYASVSKGVLELRDIIYFGSIIILFGLGSLEKID
jgi:ABC-2 type transport system permease protein